MACAEPSSSDTTMDQAMKDDDVQQPENKNVTETRGGKDNALGEQALIAAENNDLQLLRKLIADDPSLVNARDSDLYTPLHRACYNGHLLIVKFLLDNGADINASTVDGWKPLHCASKWNKCECALALVAAGADVNATTNGGQTPLHLAASKQNAHDTVEFLLWQSSIDPNKTNAAGDTPKDLALRSGELSDLFEMVEPSVNCLYPPDEP
ncbi:ankyrin repeat domain-containing protein 49-like [Tropilaelaps mercedesae]|uniref:Ankyrin repeat domain-containing protein 49-like n=1 Tax=Tropilaelaps mercedesae TaxID=418985 RepID=A0A1V9X3J3_9ACAR|nr:ankyrin repeat domain-containing protein 49-like [Tropilaelaps mercedesae]